MPKNSKNNNSQSRQNSASVLAQMRKRIAIQAALALTTITLTVIIIFAMSAAWYTNIVHTSGMTFDVEAWGFNGQITSNMVPIVAGPGDDGVISLEVASDSNSPSAVSVSFSKSQMPSQMQKRIFFYVDTNTVRNGESLSRVYLNSRESYTYNLFSQGKLTLNEQVHNDAQLKWRWVYDVLGYYVQGSPITLADGEVTLAVTEYLRPIEYDYDSATMEYVTKDGVTTMELKTVDGTRTPEEFLVWFSENDGYEGKINPEIMVGGYYPVDVDEDGSGVYAYLCSYAEIQQNTAYDTALGQGKLPNDKPPYSARLMVSAQKSKNSVVTVASLSGLRTAMEQGSADVIELTDDITIGMDEVLTIAAGQDLMLDLMGHQIITTDPNTVPVQVAEGGSLTMVNGSLVFRNENGLESETYAIQVVGAEVVMSNVNLSGYELGMRVADNSGETARDSSIRLVGCNWSTNDCAVLVYGNGSDSARLTQVIIENSVIHSNDITICGNGNVGNATDGGNYGTDIQILNSTVTSNPDRMFSAIYQPQKDSVLTIYNSRISGYTGIAVKGGTVNIVGSTVEGLGAGMDVIEKFSNSGFNDTGDAVYVETNYGYDIRVNISDLVLSQDQVVQTVLRSENRYALRVYDANAACVKINIESGLLNRVESKEHLLSWLNSGSEANYDGGYVVTPKLAATEQAPEPEA